MQMPSQQPAWNAAKKMIVRYGSDALAQVDLRIKELEVHDEEEARKLWLRIREAIASLASHPADGQHPKQ